jgi:hypothetical protein
MKIKKMLSLFLCSTITILYSCNLFADEFDTFLNQTPAQLSTVSIQYYLNNDPYQENYRNINDSKSKTAIFNRALNKYIKEIYNNKYYSNFLSQNGTHIVDFLQLSDELNLQTESLYTSLRLFYNKMKSCELIDDTVILQILKPLPIFTEKYFIEKPKVENNLKHLKESIKRTIIFKFTEHIADFQSEPNMFISQLSKDISKIAKKELLKDQDDKDDTEIRERLRNLIIRFLEIMLEKLIWDYKSYNSVWESVLQIANNLLILTDYGILNHMDDFDDLLWSLTYRFCYFLKISGSYLPVEFYEEVENDIANRTAFFLELEEQDEGIKTKKETILEVLINAKTKAMAFETRGIFSDQIL